MPKTTTLLLVVSLLSSAYGIYITTQSTAKQCMTKFVNYGDTIKGDYVIAGYSEDNMAFTVRPNNTCGESLVTSV